MRSALADPKIAFDYALRSSLPDVCCVLHTDALDVLLNASKHNDATPAQAEAQHAVAQVAAALRNLHHLPTAKVPT
jgi:aminoglycoside phosphotransferase